MIRTKEMAHQEKEALAAKGETYFTPVNSEKPQITKSMSLSLYNIEKEYIQLAEAILDAGGEITPEQEIALAINKDSLQNKAINYALVIKQQQGEAELIQKEIDRLQGLKTSRDKTSERLKQFISAAMQLYGVEKVEGQNFKLSFLKSTQLEIDDENDVPVAFVKEKITESVDKAGLKAAIKAGHSFPGIRIVEKQNLQIK